MSRDFCFNDTATTEIYTLSLHDALPISRDHRPRRLPRLPALRRAAPPDRRGRPSVGGRGRAAVPREGLLVHVRVRRDRKSTRLNSSHANISYAVFCLKKKQLSA